MVFSARYFRLLAALCIVSPAPALADIPQPVRAMVDAAIATGDAAKVATVIEIAKATNPDDAAELDAIKAGFAHKQHELAQAKAREKEARIRSAGLFENWSGSGEVGASFASGNSDNTGVTLGIELKRKGIEWSHKLRGTLDYQRSNGATTRERYFLSYEPRYQINDGLFAYGLTQYEQDRFQGFAGRYAASGGLGYTVLDGDGVTLATKLGPAFRHTEYLDGSGESRLAVLAGMNFDWRITDRLKLTQDTNMVAETGSEATVIVDSANTTINLVTGLEAKISRRLSTRLSFNLDYNSNPPTDSVSTDTLSRFTLLYGF
ncbi:membrane protein [Erythrobacter sp. SG61-1L]|uniref:DUF481 domain-containing protein n=1 Tax=Erythrobacter sp. SG61-1L TaxID=1603897 RepID=UPI0006C8FE50|nr:DUF481 domain-containing protein [Erythrobacter sp. SG61-1L]KPL67724.1 membrane protein [Erythrobacter sp. SG61-1L]